MKKSMISIINTITIGILLILVSIILVLTNKLQGVSRVINYAGLVRGATQRVVKLEISGLESNILIHELDTYLDELKNGGTSDNIIYIDDKNFQDKLKTQTEYWEILKEEILFVRKNGAENSNIIKISEEYFDLADQTVAAVETYSNNTLKIVNILEILTLVDICLVISFFIIQVILNRRIEKDKKILEKQAFYDYQTGLPNKYRCEVFINDSQFLGEPTACFMFDLNDLKLTNDTYGHVMGDKLIITFANVLKETIGYFNFVGRFGGDEFIAVMYNTSKNDVRKFLNDLDEKIFEFNQQSETIKLSYACGWAISTDYFHSTYKTLFERADEFMYDNKRLKKSRGYTPNIKI